MKQKLFNSTLNILHDIMKGQYCCNASLAGNSTVVSSCVNVKTLGNHCEVTCIMCQLSYMYFVAIEISGSYQNLTLGSTAVITCSVANVSTTDIKWLYQNGTVVNNSNDLTLEPVDYTHNGRVFTCSVNSSQLYSPGQKSITVNVKGMKILIRLSAFMNYSGTTVSAVSINGNSISALKGTNNIMISCVITLNNTIGPDYSALSVTWTHIGTQSTMLPATPIAMNGKSSSIFTSKLTINSNEFSDSGSYCCVAVVIGSGDTSKMDCITLSVLG